MLKRLTHTGSTLRSPLTSPRRPRSPGRWRRRSGRCSRPGRCQPVIHATFPLAQAAEAHALMETGAHIGKIVLTVD